MPEVTTLDFRQSLENLKKTKPQLHIQLRKVEETSIYCRFAVHKIVQNMSQTKVDYGLTLMNEKQQISTYHFNEELTEARLKEIVDEQEKRLTHSPALDYKPEWTTVQKTWNDPHAPVSASQLYESLHAHFQESEKRNWDNFAGLLSHKKQKVSLFNTQGGALVQEKSRIQWEASIFKDQYEINTTQLALSPTELVSTSFHQLSDQWLQLPNRSFRGESGPRILLSPQALAQILDYLLHTDHFNAYKVRMQSSALQKYLKGSELLFSPLINLNDDPSSTRMGYTAFDDVGNLRSEIRIIEKGLFQQELFNEREAQMANRPKSHRSGHTHSYRENSAYAYDLSLEGGQENGDMFAVLDHGYYLHDVHYLSLADSQKLTLYGLTRGGFLEVQNGRPAAKVGNMRFEVSLFDLFRQVEALGACEEVPGWTGLVRCPTMVTRGLQFTQAATNL